MNEKKLGNRFTLSPLSCNLSIMDTSIPHIRFIFERNRRGRNSTKADPRNDNNWKKKSCLMNETWKRKREHHQNLSFFKEHRWRGLNQHDLHFQGYIHEAHEAFSSRKCGLRNRSGKREKKKQRKKQMVRCGKGKERIRNDHGKGTKLFEKRCGTDEKWAREV